jgi:hypothetical protein
MRTAVQREHRAGSTAGLTRHIRPLVTAAVLTLLPLGAAADAQELLAPHISFDGFGTVGIASSTEGSADYVENPTHTEGTGHSSRLGATLDSRLAGQLTVEAGPRLTGVLQVVVEQGSDGDYRPGVEWANLSFAFTPDLSVRGGRIVLPLFLLSDARKISYANPWIRPPVELYGMVPIYAWDGVDGRYRRRVGEWTGTLTAALGRTASNMEGGRVEADPFWNVSGAMQRGEFTGRMTVAAGDVTLDAYAPLFNGFRAFGPQGEAIASRFELEETRLNFAAAGVQYDPGAWFTMAEAGWMQSESAMGERLAGYVTGGMRWGAVSPFVSVSRADLLSESSTAGLSLEGLPAEHAQVAAQLNGGLNTILRMAPSQQSLALGGRWDVTTGIALKAQVDLIDRLGDSNGTFTNFQPTFEPGGSTQLFSVAATFVF